ncbi:RNA polymerase sigma factor [Effusibacillus dendaii]|uniref:RNA polymerase sigma factor n=1 Tax=Effusibacillus dendaii TaxID=2743772 RepID=A0A7I8DD85_9BACL|nr:RNA polymerase sigma factor [Effusibacillus dendaii]BCJ85851.1 RNA polymerase sigma factor [Effusibacillus dendaii]
MFSGVTKRGWGIRKAEQADTTDRSRQEATELFASLYDEYFNKVNRYLRYRIGNYWDADDVTATVFSKSFEACRQKGIPEHFGPWIFRVAHNAYVDYLRTNGRSVKADQEMHDQLSDGVWETEEKVIAKENVQMLDQMLRQLPDEYRDAVLMKYIADLKICEIAVVLEKSEGAVKTLLYRAMQKLRQSYARNGKEGTE